MPPTNHKDERKKDVEKVLASSHARRVVAAGPGTGKSHLFAELAKKKKAQGKTNCLAITFMGKLGDDLADALCGLAKTTTMHGFARELVLKHARGWVYYPRIREVIAEDLAAEGITEFSIGDSNYMRWGKHYKAVGDDDVVHYAVQICNKDEKIPVYDLVLVDEYQDFNETESRLVDALARKNEIVIVGDDDQALYAFKGASPGFIRAKHDASNSDWESHTLRFCSRCTAVTIKAFHSLVARFGLQNTAEPDVSKRRIAKDYVCFLPGDGSGKDDDSRENPHVHLIKQCPPGMIAWKIKSQLEEFITSQHLVDVLVIGEGQTCDAQLRQIANQLKGYGFKNVTYRGRTNFIPVQPARAAAYSLLARDSSSVLGWRILKNPTSTSEKDRHLKNAATLSRLIRDTPSKLRTIKQADIDVLEADLEDWTSDVAATEPLEGAEATDREKQSDAMRRAVLTRELKAAHLHLPRPLPTVGITACSIMSSKGLGADIVFVIGFDQGRLPSKAVATESEKYQMLVALTRAKKRLYFINTTGKEVSGFVNGIDGAALVITDASE